MGGKAEGAGVAVDGLLDAAPHFVDGLAAELDNVERVEDRDGVVEVVIDGVQGGRGTGPTSPP